MIEEEPILAVIHFLTYQGEKLAANRWPDFVKTLRQTLQQTGLEEKGSSEQLLLFRYNHILPAFASVTEAFQQSRSCLALQDNNAKIPVQFVFHLAQKPDSHSIRETTSPTWNFLPLESITITRALRQKWEQLIAGKRFPEHTLEMEHEGLFRVAFAPGQVVRQERLFPYRELAIRGGNVVCFYCGMTNHPPSRCSSKLLDLNVSGITEAGYLPFAKLSEIHRKNLSELGELQRLLATAPDQTGIRKNIQLLVFVAFLDMMKVYQLRYLRRVAFSCAVKWENLADSESIEIDNRGLANAIDCIRVGKYTQAEELLLTEVSKKVGNHYLPFTALAFLALERGRMQDMIGFLDRARSLAKQEKEIVYNNLLLARCYHLSGEYYKAKEMADNASRSYPECLEARYLQVQIEAHSGFNDTAYKQLQQLVSADKTFFLTALMDPRLIPINGFVEEILTAKLQIFTMEATERLSKAQAEAGQLQEWFGEDNEKLQQLQKQLVELGKKFQRRSFYDILDTEAKAQGIIYACVHMKESSIEELRNQLKEDTKRYNQYLKFWKNFPNRGLFKQFGDLLLVCQRNITRAGVLIERRNGPEYREATSLQATVHDHFQTLGSSIGRMLWVTTALGGIKNFGRNLLLTEVVAMIFALAAAPLIQKIAGGNLSGPVGAIFNNPHFPRQAALISGLIIAPLVSLAMTLWRMWEKDEG